MFQLGKQVKGKVFSKVTQPPDLFVRGQELTGQTFIELLLCSKMVLHCGAFSRIGYVVGHKFKS